MVKVKFKRRLLITSATSVLDGKEKRLQELIGGDPPKTDAEKRLVKQIAAIEKKGEQIFIPSN